MGTFQLSLLVAALCVCLTHANYNRNHDQESQCPHHYERYDHQGDITCTEHCNGDYDCTNGEVCCVETDTYYARCPVCLPKAPGCYYSGSAFYEDNEIFTPWYDRCAICQCFNGEVSCYNTCENVFNIKEWIVPSITAVVSLLGSVTIFLSVCCCMKCCKGKGKDRTVNAPQPLQAMQPELQAHQPIKYITYAPGNEERLPLANYEVA